MIINFLVVILMLGGAAAAAEVSPAPTFNKDVLPILQKNCQTCHRPGQIAPMSFLDYKSTRPWAKAMKVAVATRKMPPWFADHQYGHFEDDRTLPQSVSTPSPGGRMRGLRKATRRMPRLRSNGRLRAGRSNRISLSMGPNSRSRRRE